MQKMKQKSSVWHPNTQMQEWDYFDKIVKGKGMWLIDSKGKKLIKISPNMNRVFYSDNGSTAMEIAFKLALQFWKNYGHDNKTKLATLENGYHGDTFGAT